MSHVQFDQPRGYDDPAPIIAAILPRIVEANVAIQLPYDHTDANLPTDRAVLQADLPASLVMQLRGLDRDHVETIPAFLLTAFTVFLARYTGEQMIRLSVPVFQVYRSTDVARPALPTAAVMLELDLADAPAFDVVLQRIRAGLRDLLEPQTGGLATASSTHSAHTVGFSYQRAQDDHSHVIPAEISHLPGDLRLEIITTNRDIQAIWSYQTGYFETATIARMHDHFQIMLAGIFADPTQSISRLPLLNHAEQHEIVIEWNTTAAPYLDTQRIHDLFEEQVRRRPAAQALTFENTTLSYHELNARANQLAHYLQRHGVV